MTNTDPSPQGWENQRYLQGYNAGHAAGYAKAMRDIEAQARRLADDAIQHVRPILPPPYDQSVMTVASKPLDALGFSSRTLHCFARHNIDSLESLATWSPNSLLSIPQFGPKCLDEVLDALAKAGLSLQSDSLPRRAGQRQPRK